MTLDKRKLLKTWREKEKMLVTSIFSFSPFVFYSSPDKFQFFSNFHFVVCKCFEFGLVKAEILSFGKELKQRIVL